MFVVKIMMDTIIIISVFYKKTVFYNTTCLSEIILITFWNCSNSVVYFVILFLLHKFRNGKFQHRCPMLILSWRIFLFLVMMV